MLVLQVLGLLLLRPRGLLDGVSATTPGGPDLQRRALVIGRTWGYNLKHLLGGDGGLLRVCGPLIHLTRMLGAPPSP